MGNGLYSLALYFLSISIFTSDSAFRSDGQTADMAAVGTAMFTCIIWAVIIQIALTMSHFTWIQHLFVWGSIASWYLFLLAYGAVSPLISGNAFKILIEALGPAAIYWISTLLIAAVCNLPYLVHISYQRACNPLDHHVTQEIKHYKRDLKDHGMWKRESLKAREKNQNRVYSQG
jgi:phospholipid-translocating ATPase